MRFVPLATVLLLAGAAGSAHAADGPIPAESTQLLLVISDGWDAVPAVLQRYVRDGDRWRTVGAQVRVALGKKGMGWGAGLHAAPSGGPLKREGDNRAPAGAFRVQGAFGYEALTVKMPYQQVTPTTECVDDAAHPAYNTIVDTRKVPRMWKSAETMRRRDDLYRYGLYVAHNAAPVVPGTGSCIFMHAWSGPARGTAGCTAMPLGDIKMLVEWLDPARAPVLVQLPRAEYERLRAGWSLPPL